ncbi:MAG TPA: hypothetical protein VNT79_02205 [Phycisphaerae bacterium]|nr:hypothetical protein [Phycisphaerae bacterium]
MNTTMTMPQSQTTENAETERRDHDRATGRFVRGNQVARKPRRPEVKVPPAPAGLIQAGLEALWAPTFKRAAEGSASHARLVLAMRKASAEELLGDEYDMDAEVDRILSAHG